MPKPPRLPKVEVHQLKDFTAWEDARGIHAVRRARRAVKKPPREDCMVCHQDATCCGRLYVPCSKLAIIQVPDVSALLCGMFFCDKHFKDLTAKEVFASDMGKVIREGIEKEFLRRGSYPNFDMAVIGRIPRMEPDYAKAQLARDIVRRN